MAGLPDLTRGDLSETSLPAEQHGTKPRSVRMASIFAHEQKLGCSGYNEGLTKSLFQKSACRIQPELKSSTVPYSQLAPEDPVESWDPSKCETEIQTENLAGQRSQIYMLSHSFPQVHFTAFGRSSFGHRFAAKSPQFGGELSVRAANTTGMGGWAQKAAHSVMRKHV